jgi:hypothetical protein
VDACTKFPERHARLHAIAQEYLRSVVRTLVVSPDNRSRVDLNSAIHRARLNAGQVSQHERAVTVLIYTNDKAQLVAGLQRDVSQRSAIEASQQVSKQSHSLGLGR